MATCEDRFSVLSERHVYIFCFIVLDGKIEEAHSAK
jgi:hypothetical protein